MSKTTFLDLKPDNIKEIFNFLSEADKIKLMGVSRQIRGDLIHIAAKEIYVNDLKEGREEFNSTKNIRIKIYYNIPNFQDTFIIYIDSIYNVYNINNLFKQLFTFFIDILEIDIGIDNIVDYNKFKVKMHRVAQNVHYFINEVNNFSRPKRLLYKLKVDLLDDKQKKTKIVFNLKVELFPITIIHNPPLE